MEEAERIQKYLATLPAPAPAPAPAAAAAAAPVATVATVGAVGGREEGRPRVPAGESGMPRTVVPVEGGREGGVMGGGGGEEAVPAARAE
jgi:hypothetical protein